jgi:hypothetical protein
MSYFEELKKKEEQQSRTYSEPLLTEELLEKLMRKTTHAGFRVQKTKRND